MASEWISCDDYLPEIGKCVIAFDPVMWTENGEGFLGADCNVGEWWGDEWRVAGGAANVTHWMPFPNLPAGGRNGW
jgi:hypothetical protein